MNPKIFDTQNFIRISGFGYNDRKFYLSEYLDAAGLTATVLRSKWTGERLEKLNVLHGDPSTLYEVESCHSFISFFLIKCSY